ncbi:hypothetical protein JZ751_007850 [Albula glossodonta]|uniref:Uncharacterized protein n=1 Tax=Albula glossodonta TaxID=121402 RepID=A0A8T2P098_9TELE|nr:hypothetical protein JZ751_007850 [Albula glossodonta]
MGSETELPLKQSSFSALMPYSTVPVECGGGSLFLALHAALGGERGGRKAYPFGAQAKNRKEETYCERVGLLITKYRAQHTEDVH